MKKNNDFIKIFVTTDNHLGYKFDDPILKMDSFRNFEEALSIAKKEKVDFVFFLGDLFDVSKPNYECIDLALEIMDKTIGRKREIGKKYDCDSSDQYKLDYYSIPALLIHGNHDRPHNQDIFEIKYKNKNIRGCLDLLERFQVIKYVGREIDHKKKIIEPFVIYKKDIKIGVYSLGYTQDDNLNQDLSNRNIEFIDLGSFSHNILIVHQNRLQNEQRSDLKPFLRLDLLDRYKFDLILWGHEHESFKKLEGFPGKYNFKIFQPGSTVATSIRQSEAINKSVGILKFYKSVFDLQVVDLIKPRKMLLLEFDLEETQCKFEQQLNTLEEQIVDYIKQKLGLKDEKNENLPLVRVKLTCQNNSDIDKYQLDYHIKKYAANKKNIIQLRRKQLKQGVKKEDLMNVLNTKNFNYESKNDNQYEKVQNKLCNNSIDVKVLNEKIYFEIMRSQNNQANMIQNFMTNVYDCMETEFQLSADKCIQKQEYLFQDIDQLLDSDDQLRNFKNQLQEDIDRFEFVDQECIELTHKMLNKKPNYEIKVQDNDNSKIKLKNQNFSRFEIEKSSSKKFKKRRNSKDQLNYNQ